ncbi:hypothetical protein ACSSS7_002783 [Eimeria intestinalis]
MGEGLGGDVEDDSVEELVQFRRLLVGGGGDGSTRETVDALLLGNPAVEDAGLELLEPEGPALEAAAMRLLAVDVLEKGVIRADCHSRALDVRAECSKRPDGRGGFEFRGAPFLLVREKGSGCVRDDALALLLRLEENGAQAVCGAVAIEEGRARAVRVREGRLAVQCRPDARARDDVTQVLDACGTEAALARVELQVCLAQLIQQLPELHEVVRLGGAVNDDIANVADGRY